MNNGQIKKEFKIATPFACFWDLWYQGIASSEQSTSFVLSTTGAFPPIDNSKRYNFWSTIAAIWTTFSNKFVIYL